MAEQLEIFQAAILLSEMHNRAGNREPLTVEITFKNVGELHRFVREIKQSPEWLNCFPNLMAPAEGAGIKIYHSTHMTLTYHGVTFFLVC